MCNKRVSSRDPDNPDTSKGSSLSEKVSQMHPECFDR